jgi:hypothetical protein
MDIDESDSLPKLTSAVSVLALKLLEAGLMHDAPRRCMVQRRRRSGSAWADREQNV